MKLALMLAVAVAFVQDKKEPGQPHPRVPQDKVDRAIKEGVEFLKTAKLGTTKHGDRDIKWDELVLWTYLHAGMAETDPAFVKLFKPMIEGDLERTYSVALQAMILEELDRVKYQWRIQQCAQFLVDNQCKNGQWSYGDPTPSVKDTPSGGGGEKQDVATGKDAKERKKGPKPKVIKVVTVQKKREGPDRGDNSNAQYAALGLRACNDAGVRIPNAVLQLGARWWRDSQHVEEEPRQGYPSAGWCYGAKDHGHEAYGSMTAGAAGALVIYDHLLNDDWRKDKDVQAGATWVAKHFTVSENPGPCEHGGGKPEVFLYYWLYALERLGMLMGTEFFGGHEWYPDGALWLLDHQAKDGSWNATGANGANKVWDTCFAILFLRRATRPLEDVATGKPAK